MASRVFQGFGLLLIAFLAGAAAIGENEWVLTNPKEIIRSEGGRVLVYGQDFQKLQDADLGAAIIEVEANSLSIPHFADSPTLTYILEGSGRAGLISPLGIPTRVRHIKKGQVWAVPAGWVKYVWNNNNEKLRAISVADTSDGAVHGMYTPTFLAGAPSDYVGGVLHGFSKKLLAQAWAVNEDEVDRLLKAQNQVGFVKMDNQQFSDSHMSESHISPLLGDFIYNLDTADPEIAVEGGGTMRVLNKYKLPVLQHIKLGLAHVCLEPGAMEAPQYGHSRLMYITKGSGTVEMTYPDGKTALRHNVKEGDLIIVPAYNTVAQMATDDNAFSWVGFLSTSNPVSTYLAGFNSMYNALPRQVASAAFNIPMEMEQKFREKNRMPQDLAILTPPDLNRRSKHVGSKVAAEQALYRAREYIEKMKNEFVSHLEFPLL